MTAGPLFLYLDTNESPSEEEGKSACNLGITCGAP